MWEKESRAMNWDDAMEYAKNLRLGGYDDWQLPTMEELTKIVTLCGGADVTYGDDNWEELTDKNIANETYQANHKAKGFASRYYWSSTTYGNYNNYVWDVTFRYGLLSRDAKSNSLYVRCVRAGQLNLSE